MVTQLPEQFRFEVVGGELLLPDSIWSETPDSLYHYTTADGLHGIIDESEFLLTNFESLNDSSEIVYGLETIARRVEELISAEDDTVKTQFDVVLERLQNARATFEFHPDLYGKSSVMVFSMSEAANDLSQWRSYSRHGEGFALQISRTVLLDVLKEEKNVGIELVPCVYTDADIRPLIDRMVRPFIDEIRGTGIAINLKDNLWSASERLAARIKHEAFRAEREWRLVRSHVGVNEIKTRKLGGRLRSVLACKWDYTSSRPIAKVIIGPSSNAEAAATAIAPLLEQRGLSSKRIEYSRIPYRAV